MKLLKLLPFTLLFSFCLILFDQHRNLASHDEAAIVQDPNSLNADIRKGPGLQYPISAKLHLGFVVRVCTQCDDDEYLFKDKNGNWWVKVSWQDSHSGWLSGWIRSEYLDSHILYSLHLRPLGEILQTLPNGNYILVEERPRDFIEPPNHIIEMPYPEEGYYVFQKKGNIVVGRGISPPDGDECFKGRVSQKTIINVVSYENVYSRRFYRGGTIHLNRYTLGNIALQAYGGDRGARKDINYCMHKMKNIHV